jgi:hypothetical protein
MIKHYIIPNNEVYKNGTTAIASTDIAVAVQVQYHINLDHYGNICNVTLWANFQCLLISVGNCLTTKQMYSQNIHTCGTFRIISEHESWKFQKSLIEPILESANMFFVYMYWSFS